MRTKLIFPFLLFLSACAGLGLQPPNSFEDRAGVAIGSHTAVLNSVTYALDNRQMSSDEAEGIVKIADNTRELIDTARAIRNAGDEAGAEKTLAMATAILRRLQAHVREKQS